MQEVRFLIERVEKDEKDVSQGAWFSLPLNHEEVAEKLDIHRISRMKNLMLLKLKEFLMTTSVDTVRLVK